ncbi:MAG: fibronectin type III-like domain-contianing protein [Terriglobia bacterium]
MQVTGAGKRAGTEIVQLYITPPLSPAKRPFKQLASFRCVELKPGEQQRVVFEFSITEQAFWYWNEKARRFVLQAGTTRIHVGNSSSHLPLTTDLELEPADETGPSRAARANGVSMCPTHLLKIKAFLECASFAHRRAERSTHVP